MSLNLDKSDEELKKDFQEGLEEGNKHRKKVLAILGSVTLIVLIGVPTAVGYYVYRSYVSHARISNGLKTVGTLNNEYTEVRSTTRPAPRYNVSYSFVLFRFRLTYLFTPVFFNLHLSTICLRTLIEKALFRFRLL